MPHAASCLLALAHTALSSWNALAYIADPANPICLHSLLRCHVLWGNPLTLLPEQLGYLLTFVLFSIWALEKTLKIAT